jgi:hypothetical protein
MITYLNIFRNKKMRFLSNLVAKILDNKRILMDLMKLLFSHT